MFLDTASAYKLLKDKDNQKILTLINEHGSLSYTDLMEKTESISERMLNHHIEDLAALINKNEKDQYVLTEKGQSALKILVENSEQIKKFERKKLKQLGVYVGLGYVIIIIVALTLYSQKYIDHGFLFRTALFGFMLAVFYVSYVWQVASLKSERVKKSRMVFAKLCGAIIGGSIGVLIAMFGMAIATLISINAGGPNFWHITSSYAAFDYIYYSSSVVVGCIAGYYIAKKIIESNFGYTTLGVI
jgi:DNA-binding HxlR family transcriptional regulator